MGQTEFEQLKQCVVDSLTPVSYHPMAVQTMESIVRELRAKCPNLELECVFEVLPAADAGAFKCSEKWLSNIELLGKLSQKERKSLRRFVEEKLQEAEQFLIDIQVINVPSSAADRKFAEEVPRTKLPRLTEEQRSLARVLGVSDEEYARGVLGRRNAEDRYRRYAEHLRQLLMKAARSYSVNSAQVIYDGWGHQFSCRLKRRDGGVVPLVFDAAIITVPLERGDENGLLNAERAVKRAVELATRPPFSVTARTVEKKQ